VTHPRSAFTLVELTIILVIMAVITAMAIPRIGMMLDASKKSATLEEMLELKQAIVGGPMAMVGGQWIDLGYENDVGALPPDLQALTVRPGSVPPYNRFTRVGWNGPYIDPNDNDYMTDAWGSAYQYDPGNRSITSVGSSETLVITF
jgi:type II secretory pathway pseudopilin PulG